MSNQNLKPTNPFISLASLLVFAIFTLCLSAISTGACYASNPSKLVIPPMVAGQDTIKKEFHEVGLNIPGPTAAFLDMKYSSVHKKPMPISKRLFIVNDKELVAGTVGGVENASYLILLDPKQGEKKYGEKGKFGVIEAYGKEIEVLTMPVSESGEGG